MSFLFSEFSLRGIRLPNRVVVSPMAQYSADHGLVTDWLTGHFSRLAMGGAGLVFTEAVKVEERGLGTEGDMGLWDDAHVAPLRRITEIIRAAGAVPGIQLNHAGRNAGRRRPWETSGPLPVETMQHRHCGWPVIGPSAIPKAPGFHVPVEMTAADITQMYETWVAAARRADAAGFEVLELHGGHGYLIHQFLSPAANQRRDHYGGPLANRMRFALELTEAVRAAWPEHKPMFFRMSVIDEGGWTFGDAVTLARELHQRGVDLIDCSAGGIAKATPTDQQEVTAGFQVPLARNIRAEASVPTAAVGLIVEPRHAEAIIAEGSADLVAIGREFLYNPFWALHARVELGVDPGYEIFPPQYGWWLNRRKLQAPTERQ
jgi:2,4-dienoyl-CoA reductase-like NADH-dependent reductase (Old Yellow Enzyme family)